MKRLRIWLVVLGGLLPLLAACSQGQPAAEEPTAAPDGATTQAAATTADGVDRSQLADTLYFFNWTDYIDPAILDDFEAEYGVRVVQDLYDSNENMLAKIRAGNSGYDVVVPSDYAVQIMIDEGLVAPLDKDLLPNLTHMAEENLDLYFDPGNAYSVPYFWGTTGIAYNTTYFPEPPSSLDIFFERDKLEEIKGRFSMLDDPRETPGIALIYLGESVNTTDPQTLQRVEELLKVQKPYVAAYDSANVNLRLATEETIIAHIWNGDAALARAGIDDKPGNPDIAFLIPEEGGVIWQDNLAILADSPNQYTAHVFLNFLMRPEIAARNSDYVLYLTPNKGAEPLLAEETQEIFASGIRPDEETIARLQWIERSEETSQTFSELWTRVIAQ